MNARRWGWLLLLVAASLALQSFNLMSAAPLAGEIVTRAEYLARVEAAAQALAAPSGALPGDRVRQAAADLRSVTAVRLPSGRELRVEPLLSGSEQPAIALARLRLTARQLALAENDRVEERLALLDDVLGAPELQRRETLRERLLRWLRGERGSIGDPVVRAASLATSGLDWALRIVGAVVALVVISFLIQAAARGLFAGAETRRRRAEGEEETMTAARARQQAVELARAGNFRAAVRRLYLATLLSLGDHGLLRYDHSLTNREMLARLRPDSPVRAGLAPVVDIFEQVWYGVQEPDQHTFDAYRTAVDATGSAILAASRGDTTTVMVDDAA